MGVNLYRAATHAPCSVERFVSPFNERQLRDINPSFEIGNHRIEGFTSASQMFNLTIVPCVGIDSRLTTFAACIMVTQKNMAFPSPKNFEYGGKGQASGFHYYFGHYTNIFITSYGQSQITAIFQWDTSIWASHSLRGLILVNNFTESLGLFDVLGLGWPEGVDGAELVVADRVAYRLLEWRMLRRPCSWTCSMIAPESWSDQVADVKQHVVFKKGPSGGS